MDLMERAPMCVHVYTITKSIPSFLQFHAVLAYQHDFANAPDCQTVLRFWSMSSRSRAKGSNRGSGRRTRPSAPDHIPFVLGMRRVRNEKESINIIYI